MNMVQSVSLYSTEHSQQQQEMITPTDTDILCGRGRAFRQHPGNKVFNKTIRHNLQRYVNAPKKMDKSIVVATVVRLLRASGARFLKQDKKSKGFYEVAADQVHGKTGHAIRDLLKAQPEHQKITKAPRPVEMFSSLKAPRPVEMFSSLSGHEILRRTLDMSYAHFRLDDGDIKKTATPDQAMSADLFDMFEPEQDVYSKNLSSETTLNGSDFCKAFEILSEA
jgi:hypothetical protein